MSKKNSNVILKSGFKNSKELSKIYSTFKKKISLLKKKSILIAVSGGPDSLALAALSKAYSYEKECKIYYVLIDHNLRKNSSKESRSVKLLLKKYKIDLKILKNKKLITKNIQSNARGIRYDLLISFCKKRKIKTILTAHNLEDQVETFFIRLSRGSGLQGLSSMKQVNKINGNINLVRPLLDIKKTKLIRISKMIFGKYFKDPTNKDKKYLRTRIRNLKKSLENSGINYDQIFRSINNLASSRDTLDFYFSKIYKETIKKRKNKIFIDIKNFNSFNQELKIRIFSQSIVDVTKAYYPPRSKKIINLINQIKVKKIGKFTLGGCFILKEKNQIILQK
ncbi:MAG: tRNA lysidine(34) synthetase TilS [Candidatus Pelagibacter sp. TMED128]|nr:MAG: tRNA lysidine(34) synthetase TilS [Candidatus Pelagibacter sp. TMED128]|tara:strand:- start:962 stop:1972 length:1011 start_codon:yes stop_codon:yes gene_type:complete